MIKFVDLQRQYKKIGKQIDTAIGNIFIKGDFILGEDVVQFEKEFADYCGVSYAVGVASGTDAILLALKALDIKSGDEVVAPVNSFISSVLPILYLGAKPILIDNDPDTYNIDIKKIEKKITKKTKAIIAVHLYGQIADMDAIKKLAKKYKLFVVEDACQAHGSIYKKEKSGTFGTIACFSFYPGKNLGAYGDGGAVVTNNQSLAEKVRILRNIGQKEKYLHKLVGYNSRLDTIQAAILRVKLKYLDEWNNNRRELADLYNKLLIDSDIVTPVEQKDVISNYHLYVIRVKKRDILLNYLYKKNIYCGIHYPIPLHLQDCLRGLKYKKGDFPIAEKYADEILSLPMFPELTKKEVHRIVKEIKMFYENKK